MTKTNDIIQRRKYPRKIFKKPVAYLFEGVSHIVSGVEIGEGGLSFECDHAIEDQQKIVINFFIPGGNFFSLKATTRGPVRHVKDKTLCGISFDEVSLALKREIRAYVSLAAPLAGATGEPNN